MLRDVTGRNKILRDVTGCYGTGTGPRVSPRTTAETCEGRFDVVAVGGQGKQEVCDALTKAAAGRRAPVLHTLPDTL